MSCPDNRSPFGTSLRNRRRLSPSMPIVEMATLHACTRAGPGDRSGQGFEPSRDRIAQWSLPLYSVSVDRGDTNEVAIRVGDHECAPEDVFVRLFDDSGPLGRPRGEAVIDCGC